MKKEHGIDLTKQNLGTLKIVAVQEKATALKIARERGYATEDVRNAYNRFWRFWVIGFWGDYGKRIHLAGESEGTVEVSL